VKANERMDLPNSIIILAEDKFHSQYEWNPR